MKGYQKAQIEARAAKVPLSRVSGDFRRADQRLREKAVFIIVVSITAISLVGFIAFYFRPWELTKTAVVTVIAPQESTQLQSAPLEPQKLQIAAQENSAVLAEVSQDEKNLKLGPTPADPQKISLQNEVVLSPVDDAARTILVPAVKPVEMTSSTVRPNEDASQEAVATALSQIKAVAVDVDGTESCVSKVRLLARDTTIYFPPSGVAVAPQYQEPLKRLAEAARVCLQVKFDVAGHTDNTGEVISNLQLSWQRAEATINFLKSQRFETSQFLPVGFSNARPASQDATGLGQAKNRRVEFVVR